MSAEDEARATAYCASLEARKAAREAFNEALAGDDVLAAEVREAWEPFRCGDRRIWRRVRRPVYDLFR